MYTFVGDIDIELTDGDVQHICQSGSNDQYVAEVLKNQYVKDQLKDIETSKLSEVVRGYVVDLPSRISRERLESYLVWLAAYNISEDDCYLVDAVS